MNVFDETLNREKFLNQDKIHLRKAVWDVDALIKSYRHKSERFYENVQKKVHFHLTLSFVHNLWFKGWNLKWILGDGILRDYLTFHKLKFQKPRSLLGQNDLREVYWL